MTFLRAQAAQNFTSSSASSNPNAKLYGKLPSQRQDDVLGWFELGNREMLSEFSSNLANNDVTAMAYYAIGVGGTPSSNPIGNYENSVMPDRENVSYGSFEDASHSMSSLDSQINNRQWTFQDVDELQSMAFSYVNQQS